MAMTLIANVVAVAFMKRRYIGAAVLAVSAIALSFDAAAATSNCESLVKLKVPGFDVQIKKSTSIPAGPAPALPYQSPYPGTLPAYCRVDGVIEARKGHNGVAYGIGFAVALPQNWNGRFLMQGGGGVNGNVSQ